MTTHRSPNLTGKKYGDLTVEMRLATKNGASMWSCYCEACGGNYKARGTALTSGAATHCGCKTRREYPTVTGLQAKVDALTVQLAEVSKKLDMLFHGGPVISTAPCIPLYVGHAAPVLGKLSEPQPPEQPPQAPLLPSQMTPEQAVARAEEIIAIPFKERGERLEALRAELAACMQIEHKAVNALVDFDIFREKDPDVLPRRLWMTEANLAHKKYHQDPEQDR